MKRPLLLALLLLLTACGGDGPTEAGSFSGIVISPGAVGGPAEASGLPNTIRSDLRNDLHERMPLEIVPGEIIIGFKEGVALGSLSTGSGTRLAPRRAAALPKAKLYRAEGLDREATLALVEELKARPEVAFAFPNWLLYSLKTPDDEFYGLQWHYDAMNLSAAWDLEDGLGSAVTVAVIDSGIVAHPDLEASLLGGYDFVSDPATAGDGDGRDADPTDLGGDSGYHGSHVAGTVAAATDNGGGVAGVSWGAKLVVGRVLGVNGSGSFDDILSAVHWAAGGEVEGAPANPNPARVLNLSLGGDIGQVCPAEISSYFRDLADAGIITVVAAGNDNLEVATFFPASCDGVITVGATGPQGERAPYSNYGVGIDLMAPGGDSNQFFSVGGDTYPAGVLSTLADDFTGDYVYGFYDGTSMAAPHVAGLVALLLAADSSLGYDAVLAKLKAASRPLTVGQCARPSASECGAGLIDAARALGGDAGPGPTPPTGSLTTYVAAFYCATFDCSLFDTDRSALIELELEGDETPFTLSSLEEGSYLAGAWQDLNDNGEVDENEPLGAYPDLIPVRAGRNLGGVTIQLEPYRPNLEGGSASLARRFGRVLETPAERMSGR